MRVLFVFASHICVCVLLCFIFVILCLFCGKGGRFCLSYLCVFFFFFVILCFFCSEGGRLFRGVIDRLLGAGFYECKSDKKAFGVVARR